MRSIAASLCAALLLLGCATKKYVAREVGDVNQKLSSLETSMEATQERTKRNETRIDEVGRSAEAGFADASNSARQALQRAADAEKTAKGKLVYVVTLSNDQVTFPFDRSKLSDDAKQMLDAEIAPLVADNRGVFFEIEGHTDATGPEEYNQQLGQDRAMAVRRYLHDEHQIALNRMEVISYGSTQPVVDNKTRANRAANRRVVVKVLE